MKLLRRTAGRIPSAGDEEEDTDGDEEDEEDEDEEDEEEQRQGREEAIKTTQKMKLFIFTNDKFERVCVCL